MKTAIGAALALIGLTVPAFAADTYKYQFKGDNSFAYFSEFNDCGSTSVEVSVFDSITKDGAGAPTTQKQANIYFSSYNYCTGKYSFSYGSVNKPDFTLTGGGALQSATLKTTIVLNDASGTKQNADVNLTWTGVGDISRGNSHSHYQGPGYMSNYRSNGSWRDAKATGSITVDKTNIIANLPNSYANLTKSNSGSLSITR
jgi:hypothetical protein